MVSLNTVMPSEKIVSLNDFDLMISPVNGSTSLSVEKPYNPVLSYIVPLYNSSPCVNASF